MTEKQKDDIYYVCCLMEFIARKTKNHRQDVVRHFTKKDLERQLRLAEVNHCLSFEQVSDELIEDYKIQDGMFDTVNECRYEVPSVTSIGMLYQELVLAIIASMISFVSKPADARFSIPSAACFAENEVSAPNWIAKSFN